jgi:hypothetical protein
LASVSKLLQDGHDAEEILHVDITQDIGHKLLDQYQIFGLQVRKMVRTPFISSKGGGRLMVVVNDVVLHWSSILENATIHVTGSIANKVNCCTFLDLIFEVPAVNTETVTSILETLRDHKVLTAPEHVSVINESRALLLVQHMKVKMM